MFVFHVIYGISSFPLTFILFKTVKTTKKKYIHRSCIDPGSDLLGDRDRCYPQVGRAFCLAIKNLEHISGQEIQFIACLPLLSLSVVL